MTAATPNSQVLQPRSDEHGMISAVVGQTQPCIHGAGIFSLVAFVDSVHDDGVSIFAKEVPDHGSGAERNSRCPRAWVDQQNDVDIVIGEIENHTIPALTKIVGQVAGKAVAAAPGAVLQFVADGNLHRTSETF